MMMLFSLWLAQYGYDADFSFLGGSGAGMMRSGADDYTLVGMGLLFLCFIIGMAVQKHLDSAMKKFSAVRAPLTGAQVARQMLDANGLNNVRITCVRGKLTDHYNPMDCTVNLSTDVYEHATVASMAVAAHECGHALQHATAYPWLGLRSSMVPMVNLGSRTGQLVLLAGLGLLAMGGGPTVAWVGLALYGLTTLFALVTLPVEFNASARALEYLRRSGATGAVSQEQAASALRAAAMTYVAAALSSLAMLVYYALIILSRSQRNRR